VRFVAGDNHVAAARELRDRYLDGVNSGRVLPAAHGKYDVSRQLVTEVPASGAMVEAVPLLKAA